MGRILKLINMKKLFFHNYVLQVLIEGCLSEEEEEVGPQEISTQKGTVSQASSTPLTFGPCRAVTLRSLVPGAQRVSRTILFYRN